MKKSNRLILIIVIILALISIILVISRSSNSTIDSDSSSFAVSDTGSITKIFLADKNNHYLSLIRNDSMWLVNDTFKASRDNVQMLLKTLMLLEIKDPVADAAREEVMKMLATSSVKVEVYQKSYRINLFNKIRLIPYEKLSKVFYVGNATRDNHGTYMIVEGADDPYVVHIPGFNGFLTTRFSPFEKDWRDHGIYQYRYNDIASVSIEFPGDSARSFRAVKNGPQSFTLYALPANISLAGFNEQKLMELFAAFEDVRFESLLNDFTQTQKDSIMNDMPSRIITVEDIHGNKNIVRTFLIRLPEGQTDIMGNPVDFDRDRLYASINNGQDFVLIQFFVFDRIFKDLPYYFSKNDDETPSVYEIR